MGNLGIIIGREYFTRVKKPSFIILTLLMPFLMAAVVFIPVLFSIVKDSVDKEVVVIDKTGKYTDLFINAQLNDSTKADGYVFLPATQGIEGYRNENSEIEAVIYITDDLSKNPKACRIYSKGEIQHELQTYVENLLYDQIRLDKLRAYNIPELDNIIKNVEANFSVTTVKWSDDGSETISSGAIAMILGLITALMIYMFVLSYGAMVMQGVMEEKTSRIVEVIVGSVKPFHLMMGKILGVMFVGFTQLIIWGAMLAAILTAASFVLSGTLDADTMQQTAMAAGGAEQQAVVQEIENNGFNAMFESFMNMPLFELGLLFILYFLGGYILYSSFYAAIGASVNSQEDSSQFMMPMVIIMIIALYGAMGSLDNTNGPLAFWASLFPLTSPIVMMVRIPFGVPLWQEVLSITLLYATALLFVWAAGRIYRVGILMYGKKPTFSELIKWIRFS